MTRTALVVAALAFLYFGLILTPIPAWQAAVSFSRPGQEDLTFWVNRNGLEQLDFEGEVGFGDLARILMRRRSNAEVFRGLRDRFLFRTRDVTAISAPDLFRAELTPGGWSWKQKPRRVVMAAGHIFNLPLVLNNSTDDKLQVQARLPGAAQLSLPVGGKSAGAYFLKLIRKEPGLHTARLRLEAGDRELTADIALDVKPAAKLRVQIVDETGRAASARMYVTGSDGLAYAPRGTVNRYAAMAAEPYFHAEGSFEVDLPAGPTILEATRGLEYRLVRRTVDLEPGMTADLQLQLVRWENMAGRGWFSGDAHIHANYTAEHHQVITAEDVRLYVSAEDLNNANMMVANSNGAFIHDAQFFEGRPHSVSLPNRIIYWNEEMRGGPLFGHMSFFNLKSLVHPLYTGFRETPNWEDWPANFNQASAAQKQGAAVTYVHPTMAPNFEATGIKELPIDVALGQVDAIDVISNADELAAMELWYRLLNCGFHLAASAGTDAFTNVADHYAPGHGRVYVFTGNGMRYDEWIRNYKRGHSFASNGPVILFTLNGKDPGEEVAVTEGPMQRFRVKAIVNSQVPLDRVEVIVNGQPAITRQAAGQTNIVIDEDVTLKGSAWVAVRAIGPGHRLVLNDVHAFAHTSPVYVKFGLQRLVSRVDVRFWIDWIEKLIQRTQERGRFGSPDHKKEVIEVFERGLAVYRGLL